MPTEDPHSLHADFPVSQANVFTAEENEIIKAVSCTTADADAEVTISVYLVEGDVLKNRKTLLTEYSGTFPHPGLHVVSLPEECSIKKGQTVAVSVIQKSGDQYFLCMGAEYNKKAFDAGFCNDNYAANAVMNPGESFIYLNESDTWADFTEIKEKLESLDGPSSYFTYDNFPIKLYASIQKN